MLRRSNVVLNDYHMMPKASKRNVILGRAHVPLLSYALLTGKDTLAASIKLKFAVDSATPRQSPGITFNTDAQGAHVTIAYAFDSDGYLANVRGAIKGVDSTSILLITMHKGLPFVEADSADDLRSLAYVAKPLHDDAKVFLLPSSIHSQPKVERDSLSWVASKNKYFLLALISTQARKTIRCGSLYPRSTRA